MIKCLHFLHNSELYVAEYEDENLEALKDSYRKKQKKA